MSCEAVQKRKPDLYAVWNVENENIVRHENKQARLFEILEKFHSVVTDTLISDKNSTLVISLEPLSSHNAQKIWFT